MIATPPPLSRSPTQAKKDLGRPPLRGHLLFLLYSSKQKNRQNTMPPQKVIIDTDPGYAPSYDTNPPLTPVNLQRRRRPRSPPRALRQGGGTPGPANITDLRQHRRRELSTERGLYVPRPRTGAEVEAGERVAGRIWLPECA